MSREAPFQDRLRDVIQSVISRYKFDGLEFSKVERDFQIDARKPDLTVFLRSGEPFLVLEAKREVIRPRLRTRSFFQPLGRATVGQAISYVALYSDIGGRIPFFATANPKEIAVFKTPENLMDFVNLDKVLSRDYENVVKPGKFTELLKYLVFHGRLTLSEEFISKLFDILAKDFLRTKVTRVQPGWALIGFLREFVEGLSEKCEPIIKLRMERDDEFKQKVNEMEERLGYRPDISSLTRMMVYVLMNKLIFYKVLEWKYRGLPRMINLPTASKTEFLKALNDYFERAIEVTEDFEPIFKTGVYDMIDFPDEEEVLEYVNEFISTLDSIKVEEIGGYAGYIYEELIPPTERHQLGQFYTPPAICELIAKWAIRSPDDVILDPGCGSGGFLLAAYRVLLRLKTGRYAIPPPKGVHEKIIAQLYGVDINPFPAHLTAMNIAMKDVRSPRYRT